MQFKSKVMSAAVAVALGVAGSAHAAFLSENGLGQVLIFPYYTTNGGYDTYLTVTNTTSQGKAVKVRFLEGKNSQEVLDFNLYLSKYDSWFAGVTSSSTGGAKLFAFDNTCTSPIIPSTGVEFRNYQYANATPDLAEKDISRVREGYVELIEMGSIADGTVLANWITHNSAGVPNNCDAVKTNWSAVDNNTSTHTGAPGTGTPLLNLGVTALSGGLYGTGSLINVAQGTDYTYDAVAIDGFDAIDTYGLHYKPGNLNPTLQAADPTSVVVATNAGSKVQNVITTSWSRGRDAVSAIIMRSSVYNDYLIDPALSAGTDWVLTFPTKKLYLNYTATTAGTPSLPFTQGFSSNGACESISLVPYSREEQTPGGSIDFSPAPVTGTSLCWEANVLTFNSTNVLGSVKLGNNLVPGYNSGWLSLSFNTSANYLTDAPAGNTTFANVNGVTTSATVVTYGGLPVVGFAVQKYGFNGLSFGGNFVGKYTRAITNGAGANNTYQ